MRVGHDRGVDILQGIWVKLLDEQGCRATQAMPGVRAVSDTSQLEARMLP